MMRTRTSGLRIFVLAAEDLRIAAASAQIRHPSSEDVHRQVAIIWQRADDVIVLRTMAAAAPALGNPNKIRRSVGLWHRTEQTEP
jgi:hypothetical protein